MHVRCDALVAQFQLATAKKEDAEQRVRNWVFPSRREYIALRAKALNAARRWAAAEQEMCDFLISHHGDFCIVNCPKG
jgi:hypothetical protein